MRTDSIVFLGKTWVRNRIKIGKITLVICESALELTESVMHEIGNVPIDTVTMTKYGQRKTLKTLRLNNELVCWEV